MAYRSYLPQPFSTTHENTFIREFSRQLRNQYSTKEGLHVLIGNLSCNGHQIDAVFVASGKIVVIDFKNYGGRLEFNESNPWRIWEDNDFVFVSGGGGIRNPYQQVNAYRHSLRQYLHNKQSEILSPNHTDCNWGHINAMVLFHQAVKFDQSTIPTRIQSFFSIVDYATVYSRLNDSFSNGLILDDNEIQRILIALALGDENIFDDSIEIEPPQSDIKVMAAQRLDLIRRLSPDVVDASDYIRILHYYHTLINLERYKEPKSVEPHLFPINWTQTFDELEINVESNPTFNALYQANLHAQFRKNIFVGINVLLNNVTVSLLQNVILVSDITDHRQINVRLSDLTLNVTALESRNLGEDEIEELTTRINEAETFEKKLQSVREYLNIIVELVPNITVAFSEESLITSQLLSELKSIIKSGDNFSNEVVKNFLLKKPIKSYNKDIPDPLLSITPLNLNQRRAVELSFHQPLTVVTGPPGTGKTQVVLNILANAVFHNKKTLFASKNNKAVDNVREKLAKLIREPNFFVRFGSKDEVRNKVKPSLQQFSNRISHGLIEDNETEYEETVKLLRETDAKRSYYLKRLQSIPRLEREIRLEMGKLSTSETEAESFKVNFSSELEIPIDYLHFLKNGCVNQLRLLFNYEGSFARLWFSLTQKNKFLSSRRSIKSKVPPYLFQQCHRLNEDPSSYAGLIDWYKTLEKAVVNIISVHTEYNEKKNQVDSKRNAVNKMKAQYDELKGSRESDLTAYYEIAESLPEIGLDVLNQVIQKRLFEAGEDSLERYISYIPDNIPWQHHAMPEFEEAAAGLLNTFSAISVTSLSIKNAFPLSSEFFDLVMVDEASQCDIASAIPLIYRAKQLIVIGDPLQLKHIAKVEPYEEKYLQEKLNLTGYQFDYVNNSLYDHCDSLAKISKMSSVLLTEHFRCHPEIIGYSNEIFYKVKFGQELIVKTKAEDFSIEPKGIYWMDTVGTQHNERNSNRAEVDKAISLATSLAAKHPDASIGITTPFRHQANEIKDRIPENIRNRVTADTVHRYQGDEKNIMILSLVVTNNSPLGKVNWINNKVPYLINVAVTRAQSTLYIIGNAGYCFNLPGDSPLGYLVRYVKSLGNLKR